jgi:hypothetical protein
MIWWDTHDWLVDNVKLFYTVGVYFFSYYIGVGVAAKRSLIFQLVHFLVVGLLILKYLCNVKYLFKYFNS